MGAEILAQLLSSLPEEERIMLTLHYLNKCSVAEIAAKLGVPERAVAQVIASGRDRLTANLIL